MSNSSERPGLPSVMRHNDEVNVEADFCDYIVAAIGFFITIASRRREILKFTLVCFAMSIVIAWILPVTYTSESSVLSPLSDKSLMDGITSATALGMTGRLQQPKADLYAALIKSNSVLNQTVKNLDLTKHYDIKNFEQAAQKLSKHTTILIDPKTSIINIKVVDKSQEFSQKINYELIRNLGSLIDNLAITDAQLRKVFYENQIKENLHQLTSLELKFGEEKKSNGTLSLHEEMASIFQMTADLKRKIAHTEIQLSEIRSYATNKNTDVVRLEKQLETMRNQLLVLEKGQDASFSPSSIDESSNKKALSNLRSYHEIKFRENLLTQLRARFERAKFEEAQEGSKLQMIDEPTYPNKKSSISRALFVIIFSILGFILSIFWIRFSIIMTENKKLQSAVTQLRRKFT